MTRLTKKVRLGAAALAVGAAAFGFGDRAQAQEAQAASTNLTVMTTDANPGGRGEYQAYGDVFKACDLQIDGYDAVTGLYYNGGWKGWFGDHTVNGSCVSRNLELTEGSTVGVQVCLWKTDAQGYYTGMPRFCSATKWGKA